MSGTRLISPFSLRIDCQRNVEREHAPPASLIPRESLCMSRIVITTFGSLGDLHPYLAVACGLQRRGHQVVLGTSPCYQQKIESLGLEFHPIRPDSDWLADPDKVRRMSHPRWGLLRVGREWLLPALRESYEDTLAVAAGADLLVAMQAAYATRLVAEKLGRPWVSAVHIPLGFFSAWDPPVMDIAPGLSRMLRPLGPVFWKPLLGASKRATRFLARPWDRLRSEIGLSSATEANPLSDSHSPLLVLALFSPLLADKQPDWPAQSVVAGFPFEADNLSECLPLELDSFLSAGPPPIVFTLGSAVSSIAGDFFKHSLNCAKLMGRRAVMVIGRGFQKDSLTLPEGMMAVEYAPFGTLFPRVAAVVHHGGVGTIGLAMRAGCPMLLVPRAWDQPDNSQRAVRLGIARPLPFRRYTAERAATELRLLLDEPAYSRRAAEIRQEVEKEDGVRVACDELERVLRAF